MSLSPTLVTRLAGMTPEELTRLEWRAVGNTLAKCKELLEDLSPNGAEQSWLNPVLELCNERRKTPESELPPCGDDLCTRGCTVCRDSS